MKLAELFVEIVGDRAPLDKTLAGVRGDLAAFGAMRLNLAPLFGFATLAGGALTAGIMRATNAASDLAETADYAGIVFGDSFGDIDKYADGLAKRFGLVKREVLEMTTGFAGIGKGIAGLKGDQLAAFAKQVNQIAVDFSSAKNVSAKEAGSAILVGLSGEQSDVLKKAGAVINETTVKQYALAHGIGDANGQLTEQQKVMARLGIIQQSLADTANNLADTEGSAANQTRKFWGQIENLSATIGERLLPAFTGAVSGLNGFLGGLQNSGAIDSFGDKLSEIVVVASNFGSVWEMAQVNITEFFANVLAGLDVLPENFGRTFGWIGRNFEEILADMVQAFERFAVNLGTNAANFGKALWDALKGGDFKFDWTPLLDGFKATVEEFPELLKPVWVDMQGEIDKVQNKLAAIRQKDLAATAERRKIQEAANAPDEQPRKKEESETRKAATVGLEEFSRKIQEGIFAKDKETAKVADNTAKTNKLLEEMNKNLGFKPVVGVAAP